MASLELIVTQIVLTAVSTVAQAIIARETAPKLFGPRVEDDRLQTSTYGRRIPIILGSGRVRIAGNVIWAGPLREVDSEERNGKGGGGTTTRYAYFRSIAIALCDGPLACDLERVYANGKLIYDASEWTPPAYDNVEGVTWNSGAYYSSFPDGEQPAVSWWGMGFYRGYPEQEPDWVIELDKGVGNTPAYRNIVMLRFRLLDLSDYGNALPNIEVELKPYESMTVAEAITLLFGKAGVSDIVTRKLDDELLGYSISQAENIFDAIQPLQTAFNFDVAEQVGQLRLLKRGNGARGTVPVGSFAATEGGDAGTVSPISREYDEALPRQVAVTHADPDADYQPATQIARRDLGNSRNNVDVNIPLSVSVDTGRNIAERILAEAWAGRKTFSRSVSDRWVRRRAGDVVTIPHAGTYETYRLERITRGASGVIEWEGRADDLEAHSQDHVGEASSIPVKELPIPGISRLILMDTALLLNQYDNDGYYYAVASDKSGWRGTLIRRSTDGGDSYQDAATVGVQTKIGDVATATPSGPATIWDRANTIRVELHDTTKQLESVTELQVLNGANAAWIGPASGEGGEVIQFATATLISIGVYDLTNLLRGRVGTEHAIGTHGADEVFVLLDPTRLGRLDYGSTDWNRERTFLPISAGLTEDEATSQVFTNTGISKAPLSPVHPRGARDSSNNLTITWKRRTRRQVPGLGYGTVELGEATEAYEIDILDGATVVRTIEATSETALYSAAEQTADGLTPGDPISMNIYQISSVRGRGYAKAATL